MIGMIPTNRFKAIDLNKAVPGTAVFVIGEGGGWMIVGNSIRGIPIAMFADGPHAPKVIEVGSLETRVALALGDLQFDVDFETVSPRRSIGRLMMCGATIGITGSAYSNDDTYTVLMSETDHDTSTTSALFFSSWRVSVRLSDESTKVVYSAALAGD